jgi:hypothetical protein
MLSSLSRAHDWLLFLAERSAHKQSMFIQFSGLFISSYLNNVARSCSIQLISSFLYVQIRMLSLSFSLSLSLLEIDALHRS